VLQLDWRFGGKKSMDSEHSINLIQTSTGLSPQAVIMMTLFRTLSLWVLAIFIVSGVAVGGIFYYLRIRNEELTAKQQQLSQSIAQNATAEGLLVSVTQRSALTKKIVDIQQPVDTVFDTLAVFVSPGEITNVSLEDNDTVSVMIHAQSITEVISMTDALVKLTSANRIRAPQLVSLALGNDGGIDVGVSFTAVF
jgi:hypothetical protein